MRFCSHLIPFKNGITVGISQLKIDSIHYQETSPEGISNEYSSLKRILNQ